MNSDFDFTNKHILVLGLGLHGGAIGNITYLASQGARITVSDIKSQEQLAASVQKLSDIPDITYLFGNQDSISLDDVDMVLRNPAVPRKANILQQAREKNIPVMMDSSIFLNQIGKDRIIGITGSKGKTTTSHAIFHVLQSFIPHTAAVGIDGVSPLGEIPSIMNTTSPVVFELSSWRLEALQEIHTSPHIAVCTSIYEDHLNTYDSYDDYIQTKKQIIQDQTKDDIAILNYDDEIIKTWENDVRGELYWYSLMPLPEHTVGIWITGGDVQTNWNNELQTICATTDIPHTSTHEIRNKLPAILIALLHGATPIQIKAGLAAIPKLNHRMQLVRELHEVQYINDTTATMPDAAIAALQSIQDKPLILILGGSDKALRFENLAQQIAGQKNLKQLIWLPGNVTERMQQEILPHTKAQSNNAETMNEAVTLAASIAQSGDIVILSPGATSFGLFLHEFNRGDAFITAVQSL